MAEEILINVTPQETRVAVLDHGVIDELHIERASHRGLVGNIYLGRVARVLPGMQSAFIEIGLERAAFLHVADIWEYRQAQHSPESTPKPIEKLLHEGQPLIVQVIKDPIGTKGARLSTQISLAGRLLVHLPQDSHIGISQRIEDEAERTLLKETLTKLLPDDESRGGFIIRTMAERATERDLARDVEYLTKLWADVQSRARSTRAGTLVHQDLTLAERVLRDFSSENTRRVLVDSVEAHKAMLDFALRYAPTVTDHIQLHEGMRPLFDMYGVEQEIERALHRRVDLKSGGYLIIDQTEALTTIDVETAVLDGEIVVTDENGRPTFGLPQVTLIKNLQRSVQAGHPWLYREALDVPRSAFTALFAVGRTDDGSSSVPRRTCTNPVSGLRVKRFEPHLLQK